MYVDIDLDSLFLNVHNIINKEDSPAALLINHEIKNHLLIRQTGLDKGGVQVQVTYKFRLIEIIFHFCCLVRL